MCEKNSIGIIGLGYWGKNLLRNLVELELIHTACDTSSEMIEQRKSDFSDINYSTNFDDILTNPDIKAVVISTPAVTHYEFAKKALNANKDVFVEKPLSLNMEQGRELIAISNEKERILMVGHILQYHSAIIKLKDLIQNGELGKVQYVYSNRLNMGKLRIEENILWSFAPHDISVILMLIGEEPTKVNCSGGTYLSAGIADTTITTLEFNSSIRAHVFVSWLHPFKEQKLVVVGSKAMAVFDDQTKEKLFIYPHEIKWKDGRIPIAHKAEHYCVELEQSEPLKEELLHFVECIKTRNTPKTDGEESLRVLKVLEEAEKSLK